MFQRSTALIKPKDLDFVGLGVLLGFIATIFGYCWWMSMKKKINRKNTHQLLYGTIRLAATQNDIGTLDTLKNAPFFHVDAPVNGFTALHASCIGGSREAALWLCKHGGDVDAIKVDGWKETPLHYAAANGNLDVCRILLAYGAKSDVISAIGYSAAEIARKRRHINVANFLDAVSNGTLKPPTFDDIKHLHELILKHSTSSMHLDTITSDRGCARGHASNVDLEIGAPCWNETNSEIAKWKKLTQRGYEGVGSEGTVLAPGTKGIRIIGVLTQICLIIYVFWRALRSLPPGWYYFYSIPIFICELIFYPFSFIFLLGLYFGIDREKRWMGDMFSPDKFPSVDIYIVCCNETVDLLEPTIIAALNMNWPGDKLTVHILDDGIGKPAHNLVKRLRFQLSCMNRQARLTYVCRKKLPTVPHYAKAGNINHALLNSQGTGEFILVLDADMIAHPDFLQKTLGHFYRQTESGWRRKHKVGFLQTPQDFYNIPANDPLGHGARMFYGPFLKGRDGCGAACCCGTGVVFPRDSLVSIGGQTYGSITEDYYTSMTFFGAGFASMFLEDRMVFGQAPEDLANVLSQRLRWAMGALQILYKNNPLEHPGLSTYQSYCFFEAAAYHFMSIPMIIFMFVPLIYTFAQISPISANHLWEFVATFGTYWILNRAMWLWLSWSVYGGNLELWRSWQVFVWQAPNNVKAIWKVTMAEVPWMKKLFRRKEIKFSVTKKMTDADRKNKESLDAKNVSLAGPYLAYYFLVLTATIYVIVTGALKLISAIFIVANFCGLTWAFLNCWCIWPVVSILLPRKETSTGWKIQWKAMLPLPASAGSITRAFSRALSGILPSGVLRPASDNGRGTGGSGPSRSNSLFRTRPRMSRESSSKAKSPENTPIVISRAASTRSNIGRVAHPLLSARSLQDSTLITSVLHPERGSFTSAASAQPTLLAISDTGNAFPALSRALTHDGTIDLHNLPPGSPMQRNVSLLTERSGADVIDTAGFEFEYGIPLIMREPAWMPPTIQEDESLRVSRLSYRGVNTESAREAAILHSGAVTAAINQLDFVAEGEEGEAGNDSPISDSRNEDKAMMETVTKENNPQSPDGFNLSELECLAVANPMDTLLHVTGNDSIDQFSNSMKTYINQMSALASPRPELAHPLQATATNDNMDDVDVTEGMELTMDENGNTNGNADFFSPFATVALNPFGASSHGTVTPGKASSVGILTPKKATSIEIDRRSSLQERWPATSAQLRMRQLSHVLVDIAESLSSENSMHPTHRTKSVMIVPVVPSSVFQHSIAATVSFDGIVHPSKDYTFIILSVGILASMIGLAIWSAYASNGGYIG